MDIIDQILEIAYQHSFQVKPGFFLEKFGSRQLRNVFISESAMAEIERALVKNDGALCLYGASKEFGYNYAAMIPLPKANDILKKEYFKSLINFFETTYGRCKSYDVDWENKQISIHFNNFIVCRKNGVGLFSVSTFTGLVAYMFQDKTIEGIQLTCEGRGEPDCHAIIGPYNRIEKYKPPAVPKITETTFSKKYEAYNQAIPLPPDYGLELLTKVGIANYKSSTFDVLGERFFPLEITFIPLLEKKLIDEKIDLQTTVYQPTFEVFKKFAADNVLKKFPGNKEPLDLLCKIFSAFGWGAMQHLDNKLVIRGFPWTENSMTVVVPQYFLGAVDGFLSGLTQKTIKMKVVSAETSSGNYTIVLTP